MTTAALSRAVNCLNGDTLRELAVIADSRTTRPKPTAWQQLSTEAVDEALTMLAEGHIPAVGWWKAHLPGPAPDPTWPPFPPAVARTRPWAPWELTAAAVDLADEHVDPTLARDVLAILATNHHLDARALADAYIALGTQ